MSWKSHFFFFPSKNWWGNLILFYYYHYYFIISLRRPILDLKISRMEITTCPSLWACVRSTHTSLTLNTCSSMDICCRFSTLICIILSNHKSLRPSWFFDNLHVAFINIIVESNKSSSNSSNNLWSQTSSQLIVQAFTSSSFVLQHNFSLLFQEIIPTPNH